MDKSWMNLSRKCGNINWHFREVVYEHLIVDGFIREYTKIDFPWRVHGLQSFPPDFIASNDCNLGVNVFTKTGRSVPDEEPNGEAAKFYKLLNEMNEELYEGSKYSKCPSAFSCRVCGKSRWMNRNTEDVNEDEESMRWHHDQRTDDGLLRHPVDSLAWKSFDNKFPSFASDPRHVRLGLASNGFNPYKIMSTSCSTWPVVLIPYNLPLWICMKQSSFILSMIIPREKALLWTINDLLAYPDLSGWSTKGCYVCPCCAAQTCSKWLYNGKKFSYMGHHWWLDENHRFRFQMTLFDGTKEFREAPEQTIGSEILFMLKDINFSYGKMNQPPNTQQREDRGRLALLGASHLRHNLDVMHIEKNICENIIGTILNVDRKSKDNLQSQLDLVDVGIHRDLHPQVLPNGKYRLPHSIFAISKKKNEV
ncbi:hypothetical protein CXB51_031901 [Gossypium anomalum]|uniref:Transposase-associated domain-containing protein n=1 Tax=Gossypium anomalum TaxID=47600 RepID=A0A8J5Y5G1_9ROSI|nr:hypothetical protein CXB51_031901 [Gossypium anomalum]